MDTNFTFPSVCAANPPPSLLDILAEIMPDEFLPDLIHIHNPLHLDNIPDTDITCNAVYSLARVCEALTSPFNTPDATFPHHQWLQLVLELFASVHEGLRNAQLAAPEPSASNAFDGLNGNEISLMTRTYEILGWIQDFFHEDGDPGTETLWVHCSRCIQSGNPPVYSTVRDLAEFLQLTAHIDARAFRESLLNQVLPLIHHEVNTWRTTQRDLLISHITSIIIDPDKNMSGKVISANMHNLDADIRKWTDAKREEIQQFTWERLCNEACENTIDLWAMEVVIHCIAA
jgi:hypothetical protein